jgi:hypothetical protein
MERKKAIEIRNIPQESAFIGTINGMTGLWWRDISGVYALDCRTTDNIKVAFARKPVNQYSYHARADTEKLSVTDYEGPLDIVIRVKGYSPWRGKDRAKNAPSHVAPVYERERDMRKGPRAVRLRDDDHFV